MDKKLVSAISFLATSASILSVTTSWAAPQHYCHSDKITLNSIENPSTSENEKENPHPESVAKSWGLNFSQGSVSRRIESSSIRISEKTETEPSKRVQVPARIPDSYHIILNQSNDRILISDENGDLVSVLDGASGRSTQSRDGQEIDFSHFEISKNGIYAIFPAEVAGTVSFEVLNATGMSHLLEWNMEREAPIGVPKGYDYNPSKGALHDYCTKSPDKYYAPGKSADFRGPCAIHDMCYAKKHCASASCDKSLHANLANNCRATYGNHNPLRASCLATADTYYAAVVSTQTVKSIFGSNKRCS